MTTFADLGLPRAIVNVLGKQGITEPFPIQEAAIPDALAGKDVLGRGPTGSGKTFTFGLPMLARLAGAPSTPGHPRGLVLAPTRELASQIRERLEDPAAALGLRVLDVVGGVNINHHIRSLASPVDLLVATPGRAEDLINQKKLSFDSVQIAALDEADQMADMGFLPQVRKLLDRTPKDGQRLLFSATLDGDVEKLIARYMHDPVTHSTAPVQAAVDTMDHYRLMVGGREERNEIALQIAAREGKTIMFMRTKHGVDRQVKKLRRAGIHAQGLHGDKGQGARTRALEGFADGSTPVLVATDIAARGIDVDDVSLVVHVDPPAEHKAYLHRAGRTARAGTSGTVVTLVMDDQAKEVAQLLRKAGVDAPEVRVAPLSESLVTITGARTPEGTPLPPPGQPQRPKRTAASGNRKAGGNRSRNASRGGSNNRNRARRTDRSRRSSGR
ncbi:MULTISPECIES: DEAD/DEAH box helicase [unclassified Corynebacterium]|uniref:DEAD/DEAH box helicase n=1 Tax=unclassified Corynebacterium TaxID=2624378 RepID=UPI001EF40198|nr:MULTISPECIES: DEAD/DEAH box helicase [unclassified Corynebacterium]MCG7289123.1 DEAD/DEAH box helicase [Corynebacterium sp. ACRPZ]MCG7293263.1 DEAD/DEAH box helicase [Corynebacterium sp. ACRPY]MDL0402617.1 DEAD/DEAH box helicase [Corynebacterium lehmanniae]